MEELLIKNAIDAMENSYSPYSDYPVGAAVLTENDEIYLGCNIENVSFGATICAERTAIIKAVSEGCRKIKKIAIAAKKSMPYPCGMCRQIMTEFMDGESEIILVYDGKIERYTLSQIMPYTFVL